MIWFPVSEILRFKILLPRLEKNMAEVKALMQSTYLLKFLILNIASKMKVLEFKKNRLWWKFQLRLDHKYVTKYESLCFLIWVFTLSFNCKKQTQFHLPFDIVPKWCWTAWLSPKLNMVVVMKTCIWISEDKASLLSTDSLAPLLCQLRVLLDYQIEWTNQN